MKKIAALLMPAAATALMATAPSFTGAASAVPVVKRCSGFSVPTTRVTGVRAYRGISCSRARSVIRRYYMGAPSPPGWSCATAGTEGGCSSSRAGRQLVSWRAPDIDS